MTLSQEVMRFRHYSSAGSLRTFAPMNTATTGDRHARKGLNGANLERETARTTNHGHDEALAVDVRGLCYAYGRYEAVRDVDLAARPGELLAVLGTNGAGKTTTLEVLEGRRAATEGQVRVLGLDPYRDRRRLASRLGVMFQDTALPDELTPHEMLELWSQLTRDGHHRPIRESLELVGLTQRGDVRIGRLSGGERRRLELAVALSSDPELLFLDEPTAGLDPESRADTWHVVRDLLRRGTTLVLTTHYLEEAEALADRLAILHRGRVEVEGTLEEVLATHRSTISSELPPGSASPKERLAGHVRVIPEDSGRRLEVDTHQQSRDMDALLAWSEETNTPLRKLHVSEPSLADVFAGIRNTSTTEEVEQ